MHTSVHQSPFMTIYRSEPVLPIKLTIQKLLSTNIQLVYDFTIHFQSFDDDKSVLAKSKQQIAQYIYIYIIHQWDIQLNVSYFVYMSTKYIPLVQQLVSGMASKSSLFRFVWTGPDQTRVDYHVLVCELKIQSADKNFMNSKEMRTSNAHIIFI